MSYKPFKTLGKGRFNTLSGSGTLEVAGSTTFASTLDVSGALTLSGPDSGSAAGMGSFLGISSTDVGVLTKSGPKFKKPINCMFTSSVADEITLMPQGIDSRAIVPLLSSSTLINIDVTSNLSMDFDAAGAGGLDTGTVDKTAEGYYVYVIAQEKGASPTLMGSLSHNDPTMPAGYVCKSQALLFIYYSSNVIREFRNQTDGWTLITGNLAAATNLTATSEATVDFQEMLPFSGSAKLQFMPRNTGTAGTGRSVYVALMEGPASPARGGTGNSWHWFSGQYGRETDGGTISIWNIPVTIPVPGSGSSGTITYDWTSSVTTGMNIYVLGWKTEAYS